MLKPFKNVRLQLLFFLQSNLQMCVQRLNWWVNAPLIRPFKKEVSFHN